MVNPEFSRTEKDLSRIEFIQNLREKLEKIEKEIKEISPEKKEELIQTVGRMSENIEAALVGGTALRVWLDIKKRKAPEEYGKDIDCESTEEYFKQIRAALPPEKEKEIISPHPKYPLSRKEIKDLKKLYRRKGKEKTPFGVRNFLKDPENFLALEDRINHRHIDLFKRKEESEIERVVYQDYEISLLSPEELFIRRISELKEAKELQRRHIIYFYLNSEIIDEKKVDELVIRKLKKKEEEIDEETAKKMWRETCGDLDKRIQKAEEEGSIKEEVEH